MNRYFKYAVLGIIAVFMLVPTALAMPDLQTMYGPHFLTDDTFAMMLSYNNSPIISGWDIDNSGGTISYVTEKFTLSDTSNIAPTKMSKRLRSTEKGVVTAETSFALGNASKEAYIRLSGEDGNKDIFKIVFGGKINIETQNGRKVLIDSIKLNKTLGLKLVINLDTQRYTLYIDGANMGEFAFASDVKNLDFVEIGTGVKEKGDLTVNGMKIHTGFAMNEQFFSCKEGKIPSYWNVESGGGAVAEIIKSRAAYYPDLYCVHLKDDTGVGSAGISRSFERVSKNGAFEVKFSTQSDNNEFNFKWSDGSKTVFDVLSKENSLYVNGKKLYDYIKNIWYAFSIEADFEKQTANIYVNNRLIAENMPFSGSGVDSFAALTSITKRSEMWVDDIWAYAVNEPETYVPEPKIAESDDFVVGMQTCDMWRDGSHYGWDCILPYDERIPYLGFYDDGSREAADWETKWMVEHGVDYRMTCWFLPRLWGKGDGPIKIGSNAYGLIDGYMRSKYSDKMKYSILWENSQATKVDSKSFRDYVVPYWVEWFLKDSRYLVIDNKPVIYMYQASVFLEATSANDTELAKENIEYLSNECKKLGFDGVTIICARSDNGDKFAPMIGADGLYSYIYSVNEAAAGAKEKNLATAKQAIKDVFIQPSISMGRNKVAWFKKEGAKYDKLEDYQAALRWVRDDFYDNYEEYTLTEKTIILPTWNEYGEGHYVAPCNLAGFGYLDEVKNVFTDVKEHNHDVPTDEEKRNFCILFPEERTPGARGEEISVPKPTEVVKKWSGSDFEEWKSGKQISNLRIEDGCYIGTSIGVDPSVTSPDNLDIDTTGVTYIKVRIKQNASNKQMSIFFIRNDDTKWGESKGITLSPTEDTDGFIDVYFPVCMRGEWKGTLKQLRVDPLNAVGDFAIESVEILKGKPSDIIRLNIDGTLIPFVEESKNSSILKERQIPVMIDGKVYMPLECWMTYLDLQMIHIAAENKIKAVNKEAALEIDTETGEAFVNGKRVNDIPLVKYQGHYVVPIRECAMALGYQVGWDAENYTVLLTSPPPTPKPENTDPEWTWNFNIDDDMQNWLTSAQIGNATVMDGILKITADKNDPQMNMMNMTMSASKYKTMFIRLKNSTSSKTLQLFFAKNTDTTIDEKKVINLTIGSKMDDFEEYEIDLKAHPEWSDTITRLRLDPMTAAGDMEIDYIRFSEE